VEEALKPFFFSGKREKKEKEEDKKNHETLKYDFIS